MNEKMAPQIYSDFDYYEEYINYLKEKERKRLHWIKNSYPHLKKILTMI
jgi:hypothetical protein